MNLEQMHFNKIYIFFMESHKGMTIHKFLEKWRGVGEYTLIYLIVNFFHPPQ